MERIALVVAMLTLTGCHKTDFESCVEYYESSIDVPRSELIREKEYRREVARQHVWQKC